MTHLIRQMGHVAFSTPDPEGSARDLADIVGVRVTELKDQIYFLSSNQRHHEISYHPGERREVLAIGLEAVDANAVEEVLRRVVSEKLDVLDDRPLGPNVDRAVRFVAPFGAVFEVHTAVEKNQTQRYIGSGSRPRRIDHVNIKAPDTLVVRDFMTKVLGMRVSDVTSGNEFMWFRCRDGFHHTLAVFKGESALHHYGFDFHALEDLVGVAETLVVKGRTLLWGPGRHAAGGNIFTYYVDPNDVVVESSVHMDRIDNDDHYQHRTWEFSEDLSGRWINQWGSPPPPSFVDHGLPYAVRRQAEM